MLSRVAADTNQVGGDIFRRQPATFDNPAMTILIYVRSLF